MRCRVKHCQWEAEYLKQGLGAHLQNMKTTDGIRIWGALTLGIVFWVIAVHFTPNPIPVEFGVHSSLVI